MKHVIKNREGKDVHVVIETSNAASRMAFVMHGLGGYKEQAHIRAMTEGLLELGYSVVTFDATNSFGESDGPYEDATVTNYYADLEDVIAWASEQDWYKEPFVLCGHSLGGMSVGLFAEKYPKKVKAIALISAVVSGELSLESHDNDMLEKWKSQGFHESTSHDGKRHKRLKWSHMEDRREYDLLTKASTLTMPTLLVVGEQDTVTPLEHQEILFEQLPKPKELFIIAEAEHGFYEKDQQQELKQIIKDWAVKLEED